MTELQFGSPEWRTHLRRSLAQRKRHGEKITDIEGLIDYIEAKGPAKKEAPVKTHSNHSEKNQPSTIGGHVTQTLSVNRRQHRLRVL